MTTATQTAPTAPAQGLSGLEFWDRPREVRSENVGPAAGERLLGRVEGPGLYFFVGENADGKTSHLALLHAFRFDGSGAGDFRHVITRGESRAVFELSPARVIFERSLGGAVSARVEHGEAVPSVWDVPAAIEILRDPQMKGEDARARARLKALLSYAPVPTTPERQASLLCALGGRIWTNVPATAADRVILETAWRSLLPQVGKIRDPAPFMTSDAIEAEVRAQSRGGDGSLLRDHGILVGIVNRLGLTAEKIFAVQERAVAKARGARDATFGALARDLAIESGDARAQEAFRLRLEAGVPQEPEALAEVAAAEQALDDLRERAAMVRADNERRQRMLRERGERPALAAEDAALRVDEARGRLSELRARRDEVADRVDQTGDAEREAYRAEATAAETVMTALANLDGFVDEVWRAAGFNPAGRAEGVTGKPLIRFSADPALPNWERAAGYYEDLRRGLTQDAARRAAIREAAAAAERDEEAVGERIAEAEQALAEAERAAREANSSLETWDRQDRALQDWEPVEEPVEQIAAAGRRVEAARQALALARNAGAFLESEERLEELLHVLTVLERAAKDYRSAAVDSWTTLGDALNRALGIPWLQIDGTRLYLGYVDGRLNNDPDRLAEVRRAAEQAAALCDRTSPVETARVIMQRVVAAEEIDWRDIEEATREADDVQPALISTAELHEACIALMLSRPDRLGPLGVIPWHVTAALSDKRVARLDEDLRRLGIVAFSERPRRQTDPPDLFLERVADREIEAERRNHER